MRYTIALMTFMAAVNGFSGEPPRETLSARRPYIESFDKGPGGWYGDRRYVLPVWDGVAYCHSPWWLDANHAPPGGGYLHLLLWTYTDKRQYEGKDDVKKLLPYIGCRFAEEGYSRDFTNARFTVRMRGEADLKSSQILLHLEAQTAKTTVNMVLSRQPFKLTKEWSEQTVILKPDPAQWTCMGSRHDMTNEYGCDDVAAVLKDVNMDIILVLTPLKAVPANSDLAKADVDRLRAVKDYPVLQEALPKGLIMIDTIKIEYPD